MAIVKNKDMRNQEFRNKSFAGTTFKDCIIDHTTTFIGCDFRQTRFNNTPIEKAFLQSCVGNMEEIVSLHIEGRIINMTKNGITIDCMKFPVYKLDKEYYKDKSVENSKPDRSDRLIKYTDEVISIWHKRFGKGAKDER